MMEISKEKKEKKKRIVSIWVCILIFIGAFFAGMISKVAIKPAWSTKYTATWSEELGTKITDISYGDEEANKFDLYLPKDSTKDTYGLVIYLHAGGFTSGDKADDENMLAWLCSKGYVAAGINYTLRTDTNNASVLLQSNEIKEAIPIVVEEAKNRLLEQRYWTSATYPPNQDNISKIELIYKTSNYHKYFAPYYCFWVSNGEKMQNGLEIYSAFYISAIEEKYLK